MRMERREEDEREMGEENKKNRWVGSIVMRKRRSDRGIFFFYFQSGRVLYRWEHWCSVHRSYSLCKRKKATKKEISPQNKEIEQPTMTMSRKYSNSRETREVEKYPSIHSLPLLRRLIHHPHQSKSNERELMVAEGKKRINEWNKYISTNLLEGKTERKKEPEKGNSSRSGRQKQFFRFIRLWNIQKKQIYRIVCCLVHFCFLHVWFFD
jgi:hypothetical protein